jgi:hypothetical protein
MMRSYFKGALAAAVAFSTSACLDLNVVNENNPDIDRALSEPADVEQVIASSFPIFMATFNSSDMTFVYPQLADEQTSTLTIRGGAQFSTEPRFPLNNDPQSAQVWIPRRPWDNFAECVANTNDGLRQIDRGMVIRTLDTGADSIRDNTARAYTFAKLMQGYCLGYLALIMDRAAIATEDTQIPAGYDDQRQWERDNLKPYSEVLKVAIASLEESIRRGEEAAPFTLPASWVNEKQYNNQELVQLAHTLIARFMMLTPRSPAERAAVDWQKVLFHTERGLTYDFGPTLAANVLTQGNWLAFITATSSELRADLEFIGQADQSGGFAAWKANQSEDKVPFFIVTTDRRVTGVPLATCTEPDPANWVPGTAAANNGRRGDQCSPTGSHFRNRNTYGNFNAARGVMHQSAYQWWRRLNAANGGFISNTGHYTIASADENRLMRAEALLRLGGAANINQAIALINQSRTRGVRIGTAAAGNFASNLPAIPQNGTTATLVPTTNYTVAGRTYQSCVPRNHQDPTRCGDVWDALIWERKMELVGQESVMSWADFRGRGMLKPGTMLHMPVPGRYLVSLGMDIYTHGGVGGSGAAP